MARRSRDWRDEPAAMQSPFGAIAHLGNAPSEDASERETPADAPQSPRTVMPKVRHSRIERAHRGGKTVTVVVFHGSPTQQEMMAWLGMAKAGLGVGGAIEDGCVILQGDQRERLCLISER